METEVADTPITTVETVITTNEDLPSGHETEIDSEVIESDTFHQVLVWLVSFKLESMVNFLLSLMKISGMCCKCMTAFLLYFSP